MLRNDHSVAPTVIVEKSDRSHSWAPSVSVGQSARSAGLSRTKAMKDLADGGATGEYVKDLCVGPINSMYLAIRSYSLFPHVEGLPALIHNTQENR
jgi:hypothetical protein